MQEIPGGVTFLGNPLTLVGTPVAVGMKAPDFSVLDNDLNPVTLASFAGKPFILSTVPSLDTPVCDMETRRFNQEAGSLGGMPVLTVSMDLPFAQKRWCAAAGIAQVQTLSDHRDASLGLAYGLLIKELRLLARAVLVVNAQGVITYYELVKEVTQEPDYAAALAAAKAL